MIRAGLRVDVDTLRGTRAGVPNLIELLAGHDIRGTFFFSVGPDNMGRHLWRLLRPTFLVKMLRTRAASLYGWDILLRGTLWPGRVIGWRCPEPIRAAAAAGHEIGLHAWDHHGWQSRLERTPPDDVGRDIQKGYDLLTDILGWAPDCFAAPAWRVTPECLRVLDRLPFRFESDCRGTSLFRPLLEGWQASHVQVPTTLPTYDECIGRQCTVVDYNDFLLDLIRPQGLNVLTIHAEVEGIVCLDLFRDFLERAGRRGIGFVPLGHLLDLSGDIPFAGIRRGTVTGREGWVSCQEGG